jgi:ribosomal protein S18 acetylase RimI-like enzyme
MASIKPTGLHVHRITVSTAYHRRGVGTKLLQQVARCALQRGIPTVTLRVAAQNAGAIQFYNRLGFHQQRVNAELLDLAIAAQTLLAASSSQELERR